MPLYEYECQQCHRRVEKIQSFNAPPETVCPHFGGKLERVISAPAIQFKGAGWYITDYAKSGGGKAAPTGTSESKTESKPAAETTSAAPAEAKPTAASSAAPSASSGSGSGEKSSS